jgi:hypothetical protein
MRQIELETPIDKMDESDLRETFSQVMEAHNENATEFAEVKNRAEEAGDLEDRVDELEAETDTAVEYFAEKATDVTGLSTDLLQTRFSIEELVELADKADEAKDFSQETDETPEEDDENGDETLFADKEQKSPAFSTDNISDRKDAARDRLSDMGGISLD